MVNEKKSDICIIGAGIGGLAAGVLLLKHGYKVKIFEKEHFIGGRILSLDMSSFTLDSYKDFLSRFNTHIPFSEPSLEIIFQKKMLSLWIEIKFFRRSTPLKKIWENCLLPTTRGKSSEKG